MLMAASVMAQNISGNWHGTLKAGQAEIGFVFAIETTESGLSGSMAIPARNLNNMKAGKTTFQNGVLLIDGSNNGWQYRGTFNSETESFEGHFKEGINEIPLSLKKGEIEVVVRKKKIQEPELPLAYKAEEVRFKNKGANIQLAGTLTLPHNITQPPVVILISGSGPQNRDEEVFGHRPFLVLSDYLTKKGIAVLRFDDRGVNESEGNHAEATTADFATDVEAAIDFLKTRKDIDHSQIGLIGHSEGGIIAPLVAQQRPDDVAFIISLAGTGVSGYETTRLQALHQAKNYVPDIDVYDAFIIGALDIASSMGNMESIRKELSDYYLASPFFNGSIPAGANKEAILKSLVEQRTSVWMRYFYTYKPAEVYGKLDCPVLILLGEKDTQVFAKPNKIALDSALQYGKSKDYQVLELEGMNHFFQQAETGEMSEYQHIEETISLRVLEMLVDWIDTRTK